MPGQEGKEGTKSQAVRGVPAVTWTSLGNPAPAPGSAGAQGASPQRSSQDSRQRPWLRSSRLRYVIFKQVGEGRTYPDHARSSREWAEIPPRPVRLDELITTKNMLDLQQILAEDSTFYGDLFPHVVRWRGELYLEDGLHRALRAALHQRSVLHARVLELG